MARTSPTNLAASVRQRLLNHARTHHEELQFVLGRYGVERLLYRLGQSPTMAERFILKGATLFYLWDGAPHRLTRDVDFLGSGDPTPETVADAIRTVCTAVVEHDGLIFLAETVAADVIREDHAYGGVRVTLTVLLGTARIPLQIDVGFGDAVTPAAELTIFPTLLDLPAPCIRAYPAETLVAEKFQAMVALGIATSRMKDYYDLWWLARTRHFDGTQLADAIEATFARRHTPLPDYAPAALTNTFWNDRAKQIQWSAFKDRARLAEAPDSLQTVVEFIATFVLPPALARRHNVPFLAHWPLAGPWDGAEEK
jgi:hypothetical protein